MAELVCRADDPQWLAQRRTGVTATDLPAILGLSRYDSLYACWHRKREGVESAAENDRLMLGSVLESYIAERWMTASGRRWHEHESGHACTCALARDRTRATAGGLYRSDERPWQLATPDRLSAFEPAEFKSWGTTDGWGDDGTDLIPLTVRAQVLWQMDTLGAARGHVGCVFLPSGEFRSYVIGHAGDHYLPIGAALGSASSDCPACADQIAMRKAALAFWESVQAGESPSPDGSLASLAMLKARFGISKEPKTAEIGDGLDMQWQHWRKVQAEAENARKAIEAEMRERAGDATHYAFRGNDGELVTFARRESFESTVKAHVRKVDRLMPVKPRKDDDNE